MYAPSKSIFTCSLCLKVRKKLYCGGYLENNMFLKTLKLVCITKDDSVGFTGLLVSLFEI